MNTHNTIAKKKNEYFPFVIAAALGSVQGIIALGTSLLLAEAVNYVLGETQTTYSAFCLCAFAFYTVYILIFAISRWSNSYALKSIRIMIKEKLFHGFLWQSHREYVKTQKGDTLTKFHHLVDSMENNYYSPLISLVRNISVLVVSMGAMLIYQWALGLGCALVFTLYLLLTHKINQQLLETQKKLIQSSATENNEMTIMLNSFQVSADYNAADYFLKRYSEAVTVRDRTFASLNTKYNLLGVISTMIEPIITLAIIGIAGLMLGYLTNLTIAGILGMTQLASSMLQPVSSLGQGIGQIRSTKPIRQEIKQATEKAAEGLTEWSPSDKPLPPLKKITLADAGFSYDSTFVLSHVNITLEAGKKYAIVGESGSGKTTFINLLLKMLNPDEGTILWNDIDYSIIHCGDLINTIAYVGQDPVMLPADIQTNIVSSGEWEREKIDHVMTLSQLSNHGSDEALSQSASVLSGGEKKRVALARAIYKQKSILILDEFTSSVPENVAIEMENAVLMLDHIMVLHITHTLLPEQRAKYDGVITVENHTAQCHMITQRQKRI